MRKLRHTSLLLPNYIADSALAIDTEVLRRLGVTHLVFDLDGTLARRGAGGLSAECLQFLESLQRDGFSVLVATNSRRDLSGIVALAGVRFIRPTGLSMKPLSSFYRRVIAAAGVRPKRIAMIGNHFLNDIIGANYAGLTTILTKPIGCSGRF